MSEQATVTENAVAFAEHMFGWKAWPHQTELLTNPAQKKIVRAGRRVGITETLAIDMLWSMFERPNSKIAFVCSYKLDLDHMFCVMRSFISKSDAYKKALVHDCVGSHQISLRNGSSVTGFFEFYGVNIHEDTTILLVDNGLRNLHVLRQAVNDPNIRTVISATPTAQDHLLRWLCTDPNFEEFHFNFRVSPNWSSDAEYSLRHAYSPSVFSREFLAEFV